jgi:hypothetical protein
MPPKRSLQLLASSTAAQMARRANNPLWRLLEHVPLIDRHIARRERAYARGQCKLLLEIHGHFQRQHPGLGGDELYARVVEHGLDCDSTLARSIILEADRSFAQWPAERDVIFRDVACFLLLNHLLPAHSKTLGVQANIAAIVAAAIPLRL